MPDSKLGVGIIGVNPAWGWAATAHIPALRALPNYELRALSATSAEAARAAGEAFGVAAVFSDHEQLVAQPDVGFGVRREAVGREVLDMVEVPCVAAVEANGRRGRCGGPEPGPLSPA